MCSPLIVRNGKASTTSFTKILETVDVTCDNGYERVGDKSALCIPEHPNKAAWKNIPKCEGRLQDCLYEGTDELQVNNPNWTP